MESKESNDHFFLIWCDQNLWKLVNSSAHFTLSTFRFRESEILFPEISSATFLSSYLREKMNDVHLRAMSPKAPSFLLTCESNSDRSCSRQSSQTQDIKRQIKIFDFRFRHPSNNRRCRTARSFNAPEDLLWTEAVRLQDGCWGVYVQFREAY